METTILLARVLIWVIAFLHLYIMVLEMFLWTSRGPKVFKSIPRELFEPTQKLAANQGLYNGFLAAGLIWSQCISDPTWSGNVALFILSCIAIAGLYGAFTAQKSILFIQSLPAVTAIILLLL